MNPTSSSASVGLLTAGILVAGLAAAYPDGAPWGSADPDAAETCASCHYDYDPVFDSAAIALEGMPPSFEAGVVYKLTLVFESASASSSGFQVLVRSSSDDSGELSSTANDIEVVGGAARTISPRAVEGRVEWRLDWRAPQTEDARVELLIAASEANDDGSALGDRIHYRSVNIASD